MLVLDRASECTGFLIAPGCVLLPAFMFEESEVVPTDADLIFDLVTYERQPVRLRSPRLIGLDKELGVAILQIEGTENRGAVEIANEAPRVGDNLLALHHALGGVLQVSTQNNAVVSLDESRVWYHLDTEMGSSGAP